MRTADDYADLAHRSSEERLLLLLDWRSQLNSIFIGDNSRESLFLALRHTIQTFHLAQAPFDLLLEAFEFDAKGDVRFDTYEDLDWYTSRSAEPVGQLVLALFGYNDEKRVRWSNNVCSALQLLNFLQDARQDLLDGRCYFPRESYEQFGIKDPEDILHSDRSGEIILSVCDRIEGMLVDGTSLVESVGGRFRWELRAILAGASTMLVKIRMMKGQTILERPKLSTAERWKILLP